MERKSLGFISLIAMIVCGIILGRLFDRLASDEAQSPAPPLVASPMRIIPIDFDWETYVQNYEDLRRAGINTEEKAKQHWMEYGKSEGREYHVIRPKSSEATTEIEKKSDETPFTSTQTVRRELLEPTLKFDPMSFRERYDMILERNGIKTKEEAIDFSLDFWEKKRKMYSL